MTDNSTAVSHEARPQLVEFLQEYLKANTVEQPLRQVLEGIILGRLDRHDYLASIREHLEAGGEAPGVPFFAEATWMILDYLEHCLQDGQLSDTELRDLVYLRRLFMLPEGAMVATARVRIRGLLEDEMRLMLRDGIVEKAEELHKVHLQEALALGYDEFHQLASEAITLALRSAVAEADRDGNGHLDPEEVRTLQHRLSRLDLTLDLNLHPDEAAGPTAGYVYALVNPSMPGLVKVGMTSKAPDERALELGSATGVPTPFHLLFDIHVADRLAAEEWVHDQLEARGTRATDSREFFRISSREAVEVLLEAQGLFGT